MKNKNELSELFREAEAFIQLFRKLDYTAILAHEPSAVAVLREVVRTIRGAPAGAEQSLDDFASRQRSPKPAQIDDQKAALVARRREYVEALGRAGLGTRLGKIYCTTAEARVTPFRDVSHKRGLPLFDMVIAPDFSPQSGYHGIFVTEQEVESWILPLPYDGDWQRRESHRFSSLEQMTELAGLLSAGFPV